MPRFKEHNAIAERHLDEGFSRKKIKAVNRWMDFPVKRLGPTHRRLRHKPDVVARRFGRKNLIFKFDREAKSIAKIHIAADFGKIR